MYDKHKEFVKNSQKTTELKNVKAQVKFISWAREFVIFNDGSHHKLLVHKIDGEIKELVRLS